MYEIFESLLKKYGVTTYQVAKATGISTASFTGWKQGKWNFKQDKLQKIADYFGVTVDYLITGKEEMPSKPKLTPKDEKDITKDIESIMKKLSDKENGPASFDGEDLSLESMELFKEELEFEECLKQRLEFICEFAKVKPVFINGSIRKLDKTNLTYIEPHKVIIKSITFLVFNYSNDVYISNLTKKIKLSELEEYLKTV